VVDYFTFVYQTCGLVFATGVNFYLGFWWWLLALHFQPWIGERGFFYLHNKFLGLV
jgi:hypothetical protein